MPSDQELDQIIARTEALLKETDECRQLHEQHQQNRENFARQFGLSADELAENCRKQLEHLRANGVQEDQQAVAQLDAEVRRQHEETVEKIKSEVKLQAQDSGGSAPRHKRAHNLV